MSTPEPPERPQRRSFARLVVEDFRSVRRWLVLLGTLAVIATAVAVYALVANGDSADEQRVEQLERRLADAERRLGRAGEESDVTKLEQLQRTKAEEADVRRLSGRLDRVDTRVGRVERDVVDAVDSAAGTGRAVNRISERLDELTARVDDVEDRQPGGR